MKIQNRINELSNALSSLKSNSDLLETIENVINQAIIVFQNGGRLLLCGNGGSAADAQHIAAELTGRFKKNREPFDAEALHTNTSYITAVANDFGFDVVYERMVKAKGRSGDMLIAISTSGNSTNILKAIDTAISKNIIVVGLTGESAGKMKDKCNYLINVPSNDTPIIQEMHILIGHILCGEIENRFNK